MIARPASIFAKISTAQRLIIVIAAIAPIAIAAYVTALSVFISDVSTVETAIASEGTYHTQLNQNAQPNPVEIVGVRNSLVYATNEPVLGTFTSSSE